MKFIPRNNISIHYLLMAFLFSVSCNPPLSDINEIKLENGDAEWALPLVNSTTNLENLFNRLGQSESLIIYPDGEMSFFYKGSILKKTASDVIKPLEDKLTNVVFPLTRKHDTIIPQDLDQLIKQAYILSDTLYFQFVPDTSAMIQIRGFMPNMTDENGEVFSVEGVYNGIEPLVLRKSMKGYTITPVDSIAFEVAYEATYLDGTEATIPYGIMAFNKMTFSYVEGYFSKDEYDVPADTIDIDLFKDWTEGGVYFKDPRISVTIDNSFGFPVRTSIKEMKVVSRDGMELPLKSPLIDNGVNIPYPRLDEIGQTKNDLFFFDKNSSNIDEVFNANPVQLIYDIDGIGNPDQDRTITGFVTDSSFFEINVEVELPAEGWIQNFELTDTFDLSTDLTTVELEKATIKMIIDNGFPIGLNSRVYLMENKMVIDSLFQPNGWELKSANVDQSGIVSPHKNIDYLSLSEVNIENLRKADQVLIKMYVSTSNAPNQSVVIKSSDKIEVKMGIVFSY